MSNELTQRVSAKYGREKEDPILNFNILLIWHDTDSAG